MAKKSNREQPLLEQSLVSVILVNYNYGKFLTDSISSILNQTHSKLELLIVDDGSTDNSLQIIGTFQDSRIRLIPVKNSGVANARNTGLENAQGSFVAFIDSDDYWELEKSKSNFQ